jgi:excisionase family DNA binding protein
MTARTLTPQQIAEILQIPLKTVYDQLDRGVIPGKFKVGQAVRVDAKRFYAWLDAAAAAG